MNDSPQPVTLRQFIALTVALAIGLIALPFAVAAIG